MSKEKCPLRIDWMCPVCGIITGEHNGFHPMAQGIGIDKVMKSLKKCKLNPEPQETKCLTSEHPN